MARTACSQAWRRGSRAVPRAGSTSRVTATWPPRTAMPPTMPCATTFFAVAGSMTASRTLRTADSVISAIRARFRHIAILCRRLIAGVAAVTYMQRDLKSKPTICRAGGRRPEVNDGVEQQQRRPLGRRRWRQWRWRRALGRWWRRQSRWRRWAVRLTPAARHGSRHPQGPGAAEEPHPRWLRILQGRRPGRVAGPGDLAGHRLLPRAAQPAGDPARVRQALWQAGRARLALQS